jgi:acyl carrier protein
MIAAVESEFGVSIDTQEYERFTSFEAVRILLEEKGL